MNARQLANRTLGTITQSTPLSLALVVGMCGTAFMAGREITMLRSDINQVYARQNKSDKILEKLTQLAEDNKRRIDWIEHQQP